MDSVCSLAQALGSENLSIEVSMQEFTMHSGVMHFISDNFSSLYKKNYGLITSRQRKRSLFTLNFETVSQLMQSNSLRVEDENSLLGFVFHYTQNLDGVYS